MINVEQEIKILNESSIDFQIDAIKNNLFQLSNIYKVNQTNLICLIAIYYASIEYNIWGIKLLITDAMKNEYIKETLLDIMENRDIQSILDFNEIFNQLNDDLKMLVIFNINLFKA